MPIRPRPYTVTCQQCGWKKTFAPLSDALGPGDVCERCEKCSSGDLVLTSANALDRTLAEWRARLRR